MSTTNANGTVTITIPSDLPTLLGPILMGLFFNWGLLGVLGTQVYIYYLCFPRDSRYMKGLVYTLFLMEIMQTCMISSDGWQWLIRAWGHPEQLEDYHLEWFDVPVLAGIMSTTVQIFFAWRIWMLGRSMILAGVIVAASLVQGSAAIASGIKLKQLPSFVEIARLNTPVSVWLAGSAGVDILIAITMIYLLTRAKNGFSNTNYLIARLIRLTVETGLLTATVAVVDVTLFNAFKTNNLHICPAIILAKLYTNTLMAVFNNRIFMQRPAAVSTSGSMTFGSDPAEHYRSRLRDAVSSPGGTRADVNTLRDTFKDTFKETSTSRGNDIPLAQIQVHTVREVHTPQDQMDSDERLEKYPGEVV